MRGPDTRAGLMAAFITLPPLTGFSRRQLVA